MERKNIANQVLAGVIVLFIIASVLKYFYRELLIVQLFSFITEAAVVGGVADWFAVTALFRKPLGFPWHTALITRHRKRVIHAISDMIQNELLSVDVIKKRVNKVSLIGLFIDWIEHKGGKLVLKKMVSQYSREALTSVDSKTISVYIERVLTNKSREIKLTCHVKAIAQWAVDHNRYEQLLSAMIDEAIIIVKNSDLRQFIYKQLVKIKDQKTQSIFEKAVFWFAEQTDSVNLSEAADAMYEEVLVLLHEGKNKDHFLYQWVHRKLSEVIDQLESEGAWEEAIEDFKQVVLKSVDVNKIVERGTELSLEMMKDTDHSPVIAWFYKQTEIYWYNFIENEQAQSWLEKSTKQALYQVIENEHQLIGVAVQSVLINFSDEDLNLFIEEKAGDDLQWIRINGCIVGGVVGLVLFTFLHYIYDPFVVPVVQGMVK